MDFNAIHAIEFELDNLLKEEEIYWKKRSKEDWLRWGDQYTKWFHKKASMRRKKNEIKGILDVNGIWTDNPNLIEDTFCSYFKNLFSSSCPSKEALEKVLKVVKPKVDDSMNEKLLAPYSKDEIEKVVNQMFPTKAPGPDGFPALFFQKYWNIVGQNTISNCLNILIDGASLKEWNKTNIVLIPKIDNPRSVGDYRPISLCNVSYKIITKAIANRLKFLLDRIISESQSAFIPGRLITDNIIVGHECIHALNNCKSGRKGWAAIKLDISKAYDRVEWSFLKEILLKIGFNQRWVNLILDCISSVNFLILINGEARGSFAPTRGLRQGDPLSPYLFLLITEGLSSLLQEANERGAISGMKVSQTSPRISHLLFADDSLIFYKADELNCSNLRNILKTYEEASGESINYSKSAVVFSPNINQYRRTFLSSIIGIENRDSLGTYLGLPSSFSRNKSRDFQGIVDKVWKLVQGWKKAFFSVAGKEVLIKSIGQALPTYAMSLFQIPKKLCEEISRGFTRFWWGSSKDNKKIHWKSWSHLCLPKELGGLNFRDPVGFNKALIAKQVWRIINKPISLVSRLLKSIYFPNSSIVQAKQGSNPSVLWKSFIWGREVLQLGLRSKVGNGVNIKAFKDPWLPRLSTFKPILTNPDFSGLTVAELMKEEGGWNSDLLNFLFNKDDILLIKKLPINKSVEDRWIWHFDKKGLYSVKSGYKAFMNAKIKECHSRDNMMGEVWKKLRNLRVPNKIKHFCWKALNDTLPTNVNLLNRRIDLSPICPQCLCCPEFTDHALVSCSRANSIWKIITPSLVFTQSFNNSFKDRWISLNSSCKKEELEIFSIGCWALWNDRNNIIRCLISH